MIGFINCDSFLGEVEQIPLSAQGDDTNCVTVVISQFFSQNQSPQSGFLFSASLQAFCLTARAYFNTQKDGLFCSLL